MQDGNWIPISKAFAAHLPKDRPYTKLEAAFSLQKKYDEGEAVTTAGLAALWRWSRVKVMTFIKELKITIEYPEDTKNIQRQRGFLVTEKKTETRQITDRNKTETRQIKFIDSKWLPTEKDRNETDNRQKQDRSPYTDINPNPNPLEKPPRKKPSGWIADINYVSAIGAEYSHESFFDTLWEYYPRKDGKKEAIRHYQASVKTVADMDSIGLAVEHYVMELKRKGTPEEYIKTGSTFFNNWKDWVPKQKETA